MQSSVNRNMKMNLFPFQYRILIQLQTNIVSYIHLYIYTDTIQAYGKDFVRSFIWHRIFLFLFLTLTHSFTLNRASTVSFTYSHVFYCFYQQQQRPVPAELLHGVVLFFVGSILYWVSDVFSSPSLLLSFKIFIYYIFFSLKS